MCVCLSEASAAVEHTHFVLSSCCLAAFFLYRGDSTVQMPEPSSSTQGPFTPVCVQATFINASLLLFSSPKTHSEVAVTATPDARRDSGPCMWVLKMLPNPTTLRAQNHTNMSLTTTTFL